MQQRPSTEQQPQDLFQQEGAQQHRAQPELEASILRFWETVRKSAETIVTLRQENARLQARAAQAADTTELRAEIAGLKADAMALRAANEQYMQDIAALRAELTEERNRQPEVVETVVEKVVEKIVENVVETVVETVVESPINLELQAEAEQLRAAHAAMLLEVETMQTRLAQELEQVPQEPVVVESPVDQELEAEIEQLRADLSAVEVRLVDYAQRLAERDEIIVDLQATVNDLQHEVEARTRALAEPVDANHERELMAIEALQERLRELEPLAQRHRDQEAQLVELQAELADVNAELQRAMTIVQRYREAGLRHLEHPDMAGQMTLFMPAAAQPATTAESRIQSVMTKDEVLALANRLDTVALRIGGLFGIS